MTKRLGRLRMLISLAGPALLIYGMVAIGPIATTPIPIGRPSTLADWFNENSGLDVAAELARMATIGLLTYLILVAAAWLVVRRSCDTHARKLLEGLTPRFVPALLAGSLISASPVSALSANDAGDGNARTAGPPPTMEVVEAPDTPLTRLPWSSPVHDRPLVEPSSKSTHTVKAGEHFWSIAEQTLRSRTGGEVDDIQIAPYWVKLVDQNRDRLIDPENPDYIVPGQVFSLPD